jgi:hypothetical protein
MSLKKVKVFGVIFHGCGTIREIVYWFLHKQWYWQIRHSEYHKKMIKGNFVYNYPMISWFFFCIYSVYKNHRLPQVD